MSSLAKRFLEKAKFRRTHVAPVAETTTPIPRETPDQWAYVDDPELCQLCLGVFHSSKLLRYRSGKDDTEDHLWHPGIDSLISESQLSCHFCTLVSALLKKNNYINTNQNTSGTLWLTINEGILRSSHARRSRAQECFRVGDLSSITISLRQNEVETKVKPLVKLGIKDTPSVYDHWTPMWESIRNDNTLSKHTSLARFFIDCCQRRDVEHLSSCNWEKRYVPKRLLSLHRSQSGAMQVRLYLTTGGDESLKYCCLSHCWGGQQPLILTNDNISDLVNGIPTENIPQTYLDAMEITTNLGVDYVWIDSLCIIQNDDNDWTEQAAAMADIYTNSHCTIAAASALNCHDGCYMSRNPFEFAPCRIAGSTDADCLFAYSSDLPLVDIEYLQRHSPLFKRAWIFQERMLSPRVLYFGPHGLAFNCRRLFASETDIEGQRWPLQPTGRMHHELWEDPIADLEWIRCVGLRERGYLFKEEIHDAWCRILREYSVLEMTKPQDKLVAISGVAKVVYKAQDYCSGYLAGLWRECFIRGLLWYVRVNRKARPTEFRAPSWSWAAVDGLIDNQFTGQITVFGGGRPLEMASILAVRIATHKNDKLQTGRVAGAYLEMRGIIMPTPPQEPSSGETYDGEETFLLDEGIQGRIYIDASGEKKSASYLMPLLRIVDSNEKSEKRFEYMGLVLHKSEKGYHRIGCFKVRGLSSEYFQIHEEQSIFMQEGNIDHEVGAGPSDESQL